VEALALRIFAGRTGVQCTNDTSVERRQERHAQK
jgi:hypothetical protein